MRTLGLLALPLLAIACGGQVNSTGGSNDNANDDNHPQTHLPTGTVIGSFDLKFAQVTATSKYAGEAPTVKPPSQDANARLDVSSAESNTDVVVTPRWGSPQHFASTVSASSVALASGESSTLLQGVRFGSADSFYVSDSYMSFSFGRTSDGGLDGTFTAKGNEQITEGDELFELDLSATGTVSVDATAPDVRITSPTDGKLLPWDPAYFEIAEPTTRPMASILGFTNGDPLGTVTADDESLSATALLKDWTLTTATVAAAPFSDPSGNASTPTSFSINYFATGAPQAAFPLDSGVTIPHWDDQNVLSVLASDPVCESGGCVKVGPVDNHGCQLQTGLAGVLQHDASHSGSVFVRYRILVAVDGAEQGATEITPDPSAIQIETATPGALPTTQSFGFVQTDLKTIPSTFGMTQATDWTTATVTVPPSSQIGVAVRFGSTSFCGGPIFDENNMVVLIDSITTD